MSATDPARTARPLLVANHGFVLGGGEVGLRMLLDGLMTRGHRPVLAVPGSDRLFPEWNQTSLLPASAVSTLRALADACDVIHTFSVRAARLALRAATDKPVLLHALTATPHAGDAPISRAVTGVICNSRATARRFETFVSPRIVYNGVRAPVSPVTPAHVRPGRRTIGLVGNVNPRKGQFDALPVLTRVLALRDDVDVVFAGRLGGVLGSVLRDRVLASGGRMRVLGFVPDIADHLASYALVLVPSRSEGFGRVAVEALRAGTPVLATAVEGLLEALGELRDPWLPADRAAWPARIVRELDAPTHTRHELEAAGSRFAPDAYIDAIVGCYEDARRGAWQATPASLAGGHATVRLPERVDVAGVFDRTRSASAQSEPDAHKDLTTRQQHPVIIRRAAKRGVTRRYGA
jgi:glycosyltransferase involved in cell wall biosynthesis